MAITVLAQADRAVSLRLRPVVDVAPPDANSGRHR